jgi:GAF domain-containing protein
MLNPLPFDELTVAFARIKGLLLTEEKVDRAMRGLVEAAKDAIPGTVGAGISVRDREHGGPVGCSTDEVLKQEDAAQLEAGQGPCITAWTTGQAVIVHDAATDARWPLWRQAVVSLPIRSLASAPITAGNGFIGAMKVYSTLPSAYDAGTGQLLEKLGVAAATLLSNVQGPQTPRRMSESLKDALQDRDNTSRACGILMERRGLSPEQAIRELFRLARANKSTVAQVCLEIMAGSRRHAAK